MPCQVRGAGGMLTDWTGAEVRLDTATLGDGSSVGIPPPPHTHVAWETCIVGDRIDSTSRVVVTHRLGGFLCPRRADGRATLCVKPARRFYSTLHFRLACSIGAGLRTAQWCDVVHWSY
jgi:hypothetical protein